MSLRYRVKSWKMASLITLCLASLFNVTSSSCGHVIEADFFFFFPLAEPIRPRIRSQQQNLLDGKWENRKRGSVSFAFSLRNGVERLTYICFHLCVCLCVMSFRGNLNGSFCKQIQSWNHLETQRLWKMITHLVL